MKQTVLKYGLISGLIMVVLFVINFTLIERTGLEHSLVTGYATMVVGFSVVYFGVRSYRDNKLGGQIPFWTAFKAGILISLITATFYVAAWEVMYFGGMADNFSKNYTEQTLKEAREAGKTEAQVDSLAAEQEKFWKMYQNPLVNIAFTYIEPLPIALLFSLASAIVLSRQRRGLLPSVNG